MSQVNEVEVAQPVVEAERRAQKNASKRSVRKFETCLRRLADETLSDTQAPHRLCRDAASELSDVINASLLDITHGAIKQKRDKRTLTKENVSDSVWVSNKATWTRYHDFADHVVQKNQHLLKPDHVPAAEAEAAAAE